MVGWGPQGGMRFFFKLIYIFIYVCTVFSPTGHKANWGDFRLRGQLYPHRDRGYSCGLGAGVALSPGVGGGGGGGGLWEPGPVSGTSPPGG